MHNLTYICSGCQLADSLALGRLQEGVAIMERVRKLLKELDRLRAM